MRVAVVQHDIVWEDAPATRQRLEPLIARAAAGRAELVVLTEMFATGFSMDTERIAEPAGGPTQEWMSQQATAHGVHLIGSVAQRDPNDDRAVNRALVVAPDGRTHRYDKLHPFTYAREHEHYRAGTAPLTVEIAGTRVSVFVCYDLRFADEFWALAPQTDCYVVPANWPAARRAHWQTLLPARAVENQAWVIGANRVGEGGGAHYAGDSVVIDPMGRTVGSASEQETVLFAAVDPVEVERTRARYPFLADRRADVSARCEGREV